MKFASLLLAGGLTLCASAAFAQAEPGRVDTRTDDQSCSAKVEQAARSRENANSGAITTKGLTPSEEALLNSRKCGVDLPPPPAPMASYEPMPAPAPVNPTPTRMYESSSYNPAPPAPIVTNTLVTNGPVPDTPENRARFGGPQSNGGKKTAPVGN